MKEVTFLGISCIAINSKPIFVDWTEAAAEFSEPASVEWNTARPEGHQCSEGSGAEEDLLGQEHGSRQQPLEKK